jgi:putative SOS response-associated peptidase YedK
MCGRYYLEISKENMSFVSNIDSYEYKTNYNISPQSIVPAIINNELINTKWGYFPSWLKEQDNSRPLFNSRYESLLEKKTFTSAFRNNRCLIPLSGWYEWRTENDIRQPYFFYNKENLQIYTAGLFWKRSNGDIETSIITREAVPPLDNIHNRSPLILNNFQIESWLSDKEVDLIYDDIKNVNYEDILFHKVDTAVNNTKNKNASLINKYEEVPF